MTAANDVATASRRRWMINYVISAEEWCPFIHESDLILWKIEEYTHTHTHRTNRMGAATTTLPSSPTKQHNKRIASQHLCAQSGAVIDGMGEPATACEGASERASNQEREMEREHVEHKKNKRNYNSFWSLCAVEWVNENDETYASTME